MSSMRSIYRKIAKEHGVSVKEVKEEMQAALNAAYQNNRDPVIAANQQRVPKKGEIPTVEEFLRYASRQNKKKRKYCQSLAEIFCGAFCFWKG